MTKFYREQKVEIFYFTNPFCYHCWSHEAELNRFFQFYEDFIDLHIIMGNYKLNSIPSESCNLPSRVFRVFSALHPDKSLNFLKLLRSCKFDEGEDICSQDTLTRLISHLAVRPREVIERGLGPEGERRLDEDQRLIKRFAVEKLPSFALVHQGKIEVISGKMEGARMEKRIEEILGFIPEAKEVRCLEEELKKSFRLYPKDLRVLYGVEEEQLLDYVEDNLREEDYRWVNYAEGVYLEARND